MDDYFRGERRVEVRCAEIRFLQRFVDVDVLAIFRVGPCEQIELYVLIGAWPFDYPCARANGEITSRLAYYHRTGMGDVGKV